MVFLNETLELEVKKILEEATSSLIYTGAGMGADSGLAVFRGAEGLWSKYPEAGALGLTFEKLANPSNYELYPEVVIPFYLDRYKAYRDAEPHSGFYELLGYVSKLKKGYQCITSNVDGLFQKANFCNVNEIHGTIFAWQCCDYNCSYRQGQAGLVYNIEKDYDIENIESLRCKECNSYLRPNICMFYDYNWFSLNHDSQDIKSSMFKNKLKESYSSKVAIIEIGAGEKIRSIKSDSELNAYELKTKVIRINPEISKNDLEDPYVISIKATAAEGIEYIMSLLEK